MAVQWEEQAWKEPGFLSQVSGLLPLGQDVQPDWECRVWVHLTVPQ